MPKSASMSAPADGETRERFNYSGGAFTRSRVAGGETLSAGAYAEGWRTLRRHFDQRRRAARLVAALPMVGV
jgi:hypothetical protein